MTELNQNSESKCHELVQDKLDALNFNVNLIKVRSEDAQKDLLKLEEKYRENKQGLSRLEEKIYELDNNSKFNYSLDRLWWWTVFPALVIFLYKKG